MCYTVCPLGVIHQIYYENGGRFMLKPRTKLILLTALTFSAAAHTEQALDKIYHVLNYSCYKTKVNAEIVEYCTPVHTDSIEKFNVPMGGYITPEGQAEIARDYAKKKNEALKKSTSNKMSSAVIPVPVAVSGGRSGSTATTSAGGDLRKKNPQHIIEKAAIEVKQAEDQYQLDLRRLEAAKKELVQLESKVEETQRIANEAARLANSNPTEINKRKAREAESTARYHQSRLQSTRMATYEKRVENSLKRVEEARANEEKVRVRYESEDTQ